jgi:hypothetical protein
MLATTVGPAAAKIVTIDAEGEVAPFPVQVEAPAERVCHLVISPGFAKAFPEDAVLVSRGREVLRLLPGGTAWELILTLPESDGDVAGLCFDRAGSFANALLVLAERGRVFQVRSDLVLWPVGAVGPGGRGPSVVHSLFHEYHGRLVVSGVSAALATPDVLNPFANTGSTLFVAVEGGFIYRFAMQDVEPHVGGVVLTSLHGSGSALATPHTAGLWLRAWSRHHGPEVAAAFVRRPAITRISIDVHLGDPDMLFGSTTPIPVALLSCATFDPRFVDGATVRCAGASPVPMGKTGFGTFSDLNSDGEADLILYFRPADMQVAPGTATVVLEGSTFLGDSFRGDDVVHVVPR